MKKTLLGTSILLSLVSTLGATSFVHADSIHMESVNQKNLDSSWKKAEHAGFSYEQYKKIMSMPEQPAVSTIRTREAMSSDQASVVNEAKKYIGVPYVWGGTDPSGFDCSGLVQYVYKHAVNINLPRVTTQQETCGKEVSLNNLEPGDLLFWGQKGNSYHVAIYIGDGKMIQATKPGDTVKITELKYYMPDFARRILSNAKFSGQKQVNGKWQYWENGQPVKNRYVWIKDQNKTCYYDGNGNMVYGQQCINGKWQYFDPITGAQAKNKYVTIKDQNKTCYYDGNGNMVYGQRCINGKWQYFDPITGAQAKNKWVYLKEEEKNVFYDGNGNMVYGQVKMGNNWKYFDPVTGAQAINKFVYIKEQNKTCYYNSNGDMVYGWQIIDGKKYYFDPITGAQAKNCTRTIDGVEYKFDKDGVLIDK